jgi:hypothetical protein
MDIEFNDIKAGYRIRYNKDDVWVDIYLYDSLSSGAGYSSGVPNYIDDVIIGLKELLESCKCEEACNNCLKHYWNQRFESQLDRKAALQLLHWGETGIIEPSLSLDEQWAIFQPLKRLVELEEEQFVTRLVDNKIELSQGNKRKYIYIHPVMWNNERLNHDNTINLSDKLIRSALPKAYETLKKQW